MLCSCEWQQSTSCYWSFYSWNWNGHLCSTAVYSYVVLGCVQLSTFCSRLRYLRCVELSSISVHGCTALQQSTFSYRSWVQCAVTLHYSYQRLPSGSVLVHRCTALVVASVQLVFASLFMTSPRCHHASCFMLLAAAELDPSVSAALRTSAKRPWLQKGGSFSTCSVGVSKPAGYAGYSMASLPVPSLTVKD